MTQAVAEAQDSGLKDQAGITCDGLCQSKLPSWVHQALQQSELEQPWRQTLKGKVKDDAGFGEGVDVLEVSPSDYSLFSSAPGTIAA